LNNVVNIYIYVTSPNLKQKSILNPEIGGSRFPQKVSNRNHSTWRCQAQQKSARVE